jgi:IS5 family transposase
LLAAHRLHDLDARPILRGRPGQPTEFGYKAQLVDNDDGIVLDYTVEIGNPADAPNWPRRSPTSPAGRPAARAVTADRGYGEAGEVGVNGQLRDDDILA